MIELPPDVDFLDFGASAGGSLTWASQAFHARGFGIDIDPKKVAQLRLRGFAGIVADATSLDLPNNAVKFCVMSHFLEHLPTFDVAARVVKSAVALAREFVIIIGPDFDKEENLRAIGFKRFWADWQGHTFHHTTKDFEMILQEIPGIQHGIMRTGSIADSQNSAIHPLGSPQDQGNYDPTIHPPKKSEIFRGLGIFSNVVVVICKTPNCSVYELLARMSDSRITTGGTSPPS
jgi:hypothetical protein